LALLGASDIARAQVNMPDPSLMNGRAIPAPELGTGTVTVRVFRESIGNNVPDQTVKVTTGSASREDTTDEQGRAEFPNLQPGVEGRAEVTVDGERLVSEPFQVPTSGGLRVVLIAGLDQAAARRKAEEAAEAAAPAVKGSVVLGAGTRILMEFRDDRLQVFYVLDIVNSARSRVDIGGPVTIELPTGAAGAATMEGSSPSASVSGDVVTVQGPFAPGSTSVQVGFILAFESPDVTIEQKWPVPLEQLTVGIERVGDVGISSPQFSNVRDVQANDGTPYLLATGPAVAPGGVVQMQLTNLPVHSRTPVYVGLGLASVVVLFGAWLAFGSKGKQQDVRQRLVQRRDSLLGELARLEARRTASGLDANGTARRQRLLNELEEIYAELDEEHSAA
jgi:hypothetical protein